MDKKLKVGMIGCGSIAMTAHLPALKKISAVELVAFCNRNIERAKKAAAEFGEKEAHTYSDYKEMLKNEQLDMVYVCTSNRSHAQISIAALEAGCHVMVEKPMAANAEDALMMLKAAERTGKMLSIGYSIRFEDSSRTLKKLCEDGELGDIYYAKAACIRRRGVPTWGSFLSKEEQGGGPLIDLGTHMVDLALWMMDNYTPKYAVGTAYDKFKYQKDTANLFGDWDSEKYTIEDSAFGFVVMENGATLSVESSWALNSLSNASGVTLCGDKAGAEKQPDKVIVNAVKNGHMIKTEYDELVQLSDTYQSLSMSTYEKQARSFVDAVLNGTDPVATARQGYIVSWILDAIYESARTGKPVYFEKDKM